ncbi:glycosyltransferase family 4 protein [Pontiellaceae bacterium B12227]|nr:glycosyltransferase family 4 protein [Pontiellaceae bacterium B12227]
MPASDTIRSLRIVIFLNILRDGAGMVNRELGFAEELAKAGADVTVLSYFKPAFIPAIEGVKIRRVLPVKYFDLLYETALGTALAWWPIRRILKELKPDVVLTDLPHETAWAVRFRKAFRYRVVYTYHGVANSKYYSGAEAVELDRAREAVHRQLKQVDQAVVVSDFLLKETRSIGVEAVRIYNGVDCRLFHPERRFQNLVCTGPVALFIGRYTECKGALYVVQAFRRALENVPNAELVMHGYMESPAYMQQIQSFIVAHGMEQQVHIFGPLDGKEMAYRIHLSHVFVNASMSESFGMPLLEAQACGVPCAAFASEGIPEVVEDGTTGYLAPPADPEELGQRLGELLADESLRLRMGAAALEHARTYQYPILKDELFQTLENVMKQELRT